VSNAEALITRYRPKTFDDVVGHDAQVRQIENALEKELTKQFLFVGNPGLGKTSLARIVAHEAGCDDDNIIEIDAATSTGIGDIRPELDRLQYLPLGGGSKALLIDEMQALSKAAVTSLLKALEEPPAHAIWLLCTTEPSKVPVAIKQRCMEVLLKPISPKLLAEHLQFIANEEKLKPAKGVVDLCAREAGGSPRQAISNLVACAAAKTIDEAEELLQSAVESAEAIDLARALRHGSWKDIQEILSRMAAHEEKINPEGVRRVVQAWYMKAALNAKDEDSAGGAIEILDAFSEPFHSTEGVAPLVVACARVKLG
jgi:DNA polymerase III gamma/tau subunit